MLNYCANGPSGYNLSNSLRFRASASAYLSRTPGSTTNQKTWTWSAWVKVGALPNTNRYDLFDAGSNVAGNNSCAIYLGDNGNGGTNNLGVYDAISGSSTLINLQTTQVFRDPSAWYHIVVAVDTTQATSTNRVKVYVNGSQVTSFIASTYPSLNDLTAVNTNTAHTIGRFPVASANYLDGYLTEINFIDGQALTPSSFGSTNSTTGVWQPAKYTGTYGTNGFYLNFSNIALTSGSNTGLGKDYSGNGNYWNTNNISVTSGTTYDAMTDVPTLTSATVANYGVLNPLDKNTSITTSNANLTANSSSINVGIRGTFGVSSGKWYYEGVITAKGGSNADQIFGVALSTWDLTYTGSNNSIGYGGSGSIFGAGVGGITTFTTGDIIGVAFDVDALTIKFYKNNVLVGAGTYSLPAAGTYFVATSVQNATVAINCGQQPFNYTPPTGYVALNTYNLPTSTIVQGNKYMDATTYTGTGAFQSITNAGSMQPDLLWIKSRSNAVNNVLIDSVRGNSLYLVSNSSATEVNNGGPYILFNSNGFSVGADSQSGANNYTYVGWQWKANAGTNTTNTAGSITSTVSVNASAGFSVVTYTGNGSAGATIGHGLGITPKMFIVKRRSGVASWTTYHASIGNTKAYFLNQADTGDTYVGYFNNTSPTSSVFSVGIDVSVNTNGSNYVAYCWAEILGFSKIGSYTGNGVNNDGPFVYCGFRPRFVMFKNSSTSQNWIIMDTARDSYNKMTQWLFPNTSGAEYTDANIAVDYLSNGFKIRTQIGTELNGNGNTIIYAAFAENPFKNALAR